MKGQSHKKAVYLAFEKPELREVRRGKWNQFKYKTCKGFSPQVNFSGPKILVTFKIKDLETSDCVKDFGKAPLAGLG